MVRRRRFNYIWNQSLSNNKIALQDSLVKWVFQEEKDNLASEA